MLNICKHQVLQASGNVLVPCNLSVSRIMGSLDLFSHAQFLVTLPVTLI